MLVDPALSGLPAFLTPRPGLNSGFMIPQVTAAALVSENKQRAYPASVDSIPTSANQEDHVSMAAHGARRLLAMVENAAGVIGIELLAAAQGCDFHAPLASSAALEACARCCARTCRVSTTTGTSTPTWQAAIALVAAGALAEAAGVGAAGRWRHERLADDPSQGDAPLIVGLPHTGTRHPRRAASRASSRRGSRARMPTGGSTSSTTSPPSSARPSCAPRSRAR